MKSKKILISLFCAGVLACGLNFNNLKVSAAKTSNKQASYGATATVAGPSSVGAIENPLESRSKEQKLIDRSLQKIIATGLRCSRDPLFITYMKEKGLLTYVKELGKEEYKAEASKRIKDLRDYLETWVHSFFEDSWELMVLCDGSILGPLGQICSDNIDRHDGNARSKATHKLKETIRDIVKTCLDELKGKSPFNERTAEIVERLANNKDTLDDYSVLSSINLNDLNEDFLKILDKKLPTSSLSLIPQLKKEISKLRFF